LTPTRHLVLMRRHIPHPSKAQRRKGSKNTPCKFKAKYSKKRFNKNH